jgi:predicted nucleic acid-binding protein
MAATISLYVDTSAVVPLFVREASTDRLRDFLEREDSDRLAISPWVRTEFASALALRLRLGSLDEGVHAAASLQWERFQEGVQSLEITGRHFEEAAAICRRQELALRAGDALHLAVAAAAGCALVTLDERMAKAAPEVGVPVANVGVA